MLELNVSISSYDIILHQHNPLGVVRLFLFHLASYQIDSGALYVRGHGFSAHASVCSTIAPKMSDFSLIVKFIVKG